MKTIKGDLVLKKDTEFKESIKVEGNIYGENNRRFNLKVEGNIKCKNINCLDIKCRDIDAVNIDAADIDAIDIKCRNINCDFIICNKIENTGQIIYRGIIKNRFKLERKERK